MLVHRGHLGIPWKDLRACHEKGCADDHEEQQFVAKDLVERECMVNDVCALILKVGAVS